MQRSPRTGRGSSSSSSRPSILVPGRPAPICRIEQPSPGGEHARDRILAESFVERARNAGSEQAEAERGQRSEQSDAERVTQFVAGFRDRPRCARAVGAARRLPSQ
jgi:hypothetical protein